MELLNYLKAHSIVSVGNLALNKCVIAEMIPDNCKDVVEYIIKSNCYISEIRWWDRALISQKSKIGYGGTLDPRDPLNFYFAETDICDSFDKKTTASEYLGYIDKIRTKNSEYDLYPAFDVYQK